MIKVTIEGKTFFYSMTLNKTIFPSPYLTYLSLYFFFSVFQNLRKLETHFLKLQFFLC